jgi:hypothetical protein
MAETTVSLLQAVGQLGAGGVFTILLLREILPFVVKIRGKGDERGNAKMDRGWDALASQADMRNLIESIELHTRAIRSLMEHEDEEKRLLNRIEKQLDRFEQ